MLDWVGCLPGAILRRPDGANKGQMDSHIETKAPSQSIPHLLRSVFKLLMLDRGVTTPGMMRKVISNFQCYINQFSGWARAGKKYLAMLYKARWPTIPSSASIYFQRHQIHFEPWFIMLKCTF